MADWKRMTLERLEQDWLRLKKGEIVGSLYHFGYCPRCNDITEISTYSDSDYGSGALVTTYYFRCLQCGYGYNYSAHTNIMPNPEYRIMVTGDQIPPNLKKRWERMRKRTHQMRVHKQKMGAFLDKLEVERQEVEQICREANQRLGGLVREKR